MVLALFTKEVVFLGLREVWVFEKMKCIFSIAPVGFFGEVAGVFLSRKHSPDALRGGTGRGPLASGVLSGAAECTGRTGESPVVSVRCVGGLVTLSAHESGVVSVAQVCTGRTGESPVLSVRCAGGLATLSAHASGEHRTLTVRPVTVLVCGALCARVRCAPDASGVD